jgi:hypothetical protein
LAAFCAGCLGSEFNPHPLPFKAEDGYFQMAQADGSYRPFFIKGVNLGTGLPGTQAGALAITHEQYLRWFQRMSDVGINAFRVYTLHHPRFYEALFEFNNFRPENPLFFMQGLWLDEEIEPHSFDLHDFTEGFVAENHRVIDAVHGNIEIEHRLGRAYGKYEVNVSDWCIGYIIGREVFPDEIIETDAGREPGAYYGNNVTLPMGSPTELWWAERVDEVLQYERDNYGVQHPIAVSSWPTLDPLHHYTETHFGFGEDDQQIDMANLELVNAPGGFFASFHAYPYYPNFVSEQPEYQAFSDEIGPNSYLGYITALVDHYHPFPLLLGEFGIPTSWGNAHYGHSGMNHGGHTDIEQGLGAGRMLRNMLEAGSCGGFLFAWQDEWWKRTWIVDDLANPRERYRLWHNVTSPEDNFGLIRFALDPPTFATFPAVTGGNAIRRVELDTDAAFFYVRLELEHALADNEELVIGYDTYGDSLGETILPNGVTTSRRNEFAVVYKAPSEAQLYVVPSYDTLGIWHGITEPTQIFQSTASSNGDWNPVIWMNNSDHHSDDFMYVFPATYDEIGKLRIRNVDDEEHLDDSVIVNGTQITIRVPWTLLHFADPTQLQVLHDIAGTKERESQTSPGIAVGVSFDGDLIETNRFAWSVWEQAPPTTEVEKRSMELLRQALAELPFFLD